MTVRELCKVSLLALEIRKGAVARMWRHRGHPPMHSIKFFRKISYGVKGVTTFLTEEA
jgi:hypothetical protein